MCFTKPGLDPNALDAVVTEKGRERLFLPSFITVPGDCLLQWVPMWLTLWGERGGEQDSTLRQPGRGFMVSSPG